MRHQKKRSVTAEFTCCTTLYVDQQSGEYHLCANRVMAIAAYRINGEQVDSVMETRWEYQMDCSAYVPSTDPMTAMTAAALCGTTTTPSVGGYIASEADATKRVFLLRGGREQVHAKPNAAVVQRECYRRHCHTCHSTPWSAPTERAHGHCTAPTSRRGRRTASSCRMRLMARQPQQKSSRLTPAATTPGTRRAPTTLSSCSGAATKTTLLQR